MTNGHANVTQLPTPVFVICATADTARRIAEFIRQGDLPPIHLTEKAAITTWMGQASGYGKYHVWKVIHMPGEYTRCEQLTDIHTTLRT